MTRDARTQFDEDVFTFRITKDRKVRISWQGSVVTTVAGPPAEKLIGKIERSDRREIQHLLARATGNFKRGNERRS